MVACAAQPVQSPQPTPLPARARNSCTVSSAKPPNGAASPAPPGRTAPRPAPAADDGLAASGGFDLGPRLRLDFESGLHYAFSANLTGVIGYGDVSDDEGEGLSLDGPSLGFTFRF